MAFTTEQEAALTQIIEAFQNGKRLSDLPHVDGTNPFNLITEVLDEDGESKQAALASLLPYMEEQCMYGIERDITVSATTCTRIGNMALHRSLPIQNRMIGVLLDDDGNEVEYLNPKDWTAHDRSGARGQVMVKIPMFYCKYETEGNIMRVKFSEYPLPGYHVSPEMYISAYEATVQRSANKLSSVVNTSADFRGGNNNSANDGAANSSLGMPATSISRTNFRNFARNRKAGSSEWNCMLYDAQKLLYWLYVVEYANTNVQVAYNPQLTSEGYKQGGLGNGIVNINYEKWNSFNGVSPIIPCGYTDALGNGTGVVNFTMPTEYDSAATLTMGVPRYRGIENPFGHIWKWVDGINVRISPTEENGGDGLSKVYVCHDPANFKDNSYDGYRYIGNEARAEGYVKELLFGEEGDIMPSEIGAGSSTYFADYHYTNIPTSEALRGFLFGGYAFSGAYAGLVYANSYCVPSNTSTNVGSRLCFLPNRR